MNYTDEQAREILENAQAPKEGNLFVNLGNCAYLGTFTKNQHGVKVSHGVGLVVDGNGTPQFYDDAVYPRDTSFARGEDLSEATINRMRVLQSRINKAINELEL